MQPMNVFDGVMRLWQKAPLAWRQSIVTARFAPRLRRIVNRVYPQQLGIFPLAAPLDGHRMRLHWQTRKAYVFGTWEPEVAQVIQREVRPSQLVLDIGANIGYFTLLLAKQVGPEGKVIAFEPFPKIFEVLKENVALNGYQNVVLESKAVADRTGPVSLSQKGKEPLSTVESIVSGPGITVQAVALDDYFDGRRDRIDFIKVDVEGAESLVLEGMHNVLSRDRPILLVELHGFNTTGERHPALLRLREAGYAVSFVDKAGYLAHVLAKADR
jgi:FkbM family methyltransferase